MVAVGDTAVLVDVGIDGRQLGRALAHAGLRPADLTAVVLTHEHGDHVRGLDALRAAAPGLTVYASRGTARALAGADDAATFTAVRAGEPVQVGALRVLAFGVSHDAREPVGFRIEAPGFSMGIATDLGVAPRVVASALMGCRVLVLEANHDDDMLWGGRYPAFLKRRIASPRGHLSNGQTAALLQTVAHPALERVILAHLSRENNDPHRAVDIAAAALDGSSSAWIQAAPRREPGDVLAFEPRSGFGPTRADERPLPRQLDLFGAP